MFLIPGKGPEPAAGGVLRIQADDGVDLRVHHDQGPSSELAFVLAHGFTGNAQQPKVRRIATLLNRWGGVLSLDFRGHGGSAGWCTLGHLEVLDVAAAVRLARDLGYRQVASIGFSMGASVVIRQAYLDRDGPSAVNAVVAVSGPAFWYYRGTPVMRVVHHLVEHAAGRAALRARGVRLWGGGWPTPPPVPPFEAVAGLGHVPLIIVHGDVDRYFPLDHPRALHRAARQAEHPDTELWVIPGMGHAESAIDPVTVASIAQWVQTRVRAAQGPR
jgi:pimeloyl-ACP methyl ester carboxylesterase